MNKDGEEKNLSPKQDCTVTHFLTLLQKNKNKILTFIHLSFKGLPHMNKTMIHFSVNCIISCWILKSNKSLLVIYHGIRVFCIWPLAEETFL